MLSGNEIFIIALLSIAGVTICAVIKTTCWFKDQKYQTIEL